jgi:plasmid stabilization system protein ParE
MKVFWATAAQTDRADIFDYISQDSPLAAIRMDELFADAAARLADHPRLGKAGLIPGTRCAGVRQLTASSALWCLGRS